MVGVKFIKRYEALQGGKCNKRGSKDTKMEMRGLEGRRKGERGDSRVRQVINSSNLKG